MEQAQGRDTYLTIVLCGYGTREKGRKTCCFCAVVAAATTT
jgi:hypothetical protein